MQINSYLKKYITEPIHCRLPSIEVVKGDVIVNKKYQVFVSSTYEDLKEERAAVMQCLLDNDCIPVGMEQFPASNMSQMDYITKMLQNCDYYILILAGKYGSIDPHTNLGYTEEEYDYAISHKIPVLSFVVQNIGTLTNNKCEQTDEGKHRLELFRQKVLQNKLAKKYINKDSLRAEVITSLHQCIKDFPAVGWVRGDESGIDRIPEGLSEKDVATDEEVQQMLDEVFDKKAE